jgi:hypothetical protein
MTSAISQERLYLDTLAIKTSAAPRWKRRSQHRVAGRE